MPKNVLLFIVICCLLPALGLSQTDTLLKLPTVEVAGDRPRTQTVGGHTQSWTKTTLHPQLHTNLGEWLSEAGGLFVKSSGNGGIATTSIRGGSAAHTTVLWNGLPIQSPMLGQLDFSLFPLAFIDGIALHYGGNSAAWGSGAVGGVVDLESRLPTDSTRSLSWRSTLGSFGFQDHQLQAAYSQKRWGVSTRLFYRRARNDFPYSLGAGQRRQRQPNAAIRQSGLLQSVFWKPGPNQQLSLFLWVQGSDREIPPTSVQRESQAAQADDFSRLLLHWKSTGNAIIWQARFGLFNENIDYRDDAIRLRALSGFRTARLEATGTWAGNGRQQLLFGLNHGWTSAQADAYISPPEQRRTAAFISYQHRLSKWQSQLNLRQEIVDGVFLPPVPGLGIEGQLTAMLSVQARFSRNYRLPTLNDQYWQPGGNPGLLPESGWSQEAGFRLRKQLPGHRLTYQLTGFNRNMRNWILWSKPTGQAYWSSNNIAKVWSRGLEQRLHWDWQLHRWRGQLMAGYDYIRSTNEIAVVNPKLEKGDQLVYVPEHQAFGQITLRWQQLAIHYRHTHTGSVRGLNVGRLPAYQLGSAGIHYTWPNAPGKLQLFFQANNLWNEEYRVIERQPMPGRHFRFGLQSNFQNKHQHL